VKRVDLVRHLQKHGCELLREGSKHSVFVNPSSRRVSTVPRPREINEYLAIKICRDLAVPEIQAEDRTALTVVSRVNRVSVPASPAADPPLERPCMGAPRNVRKALGTFPAMGGDNCHGCLRVPPRRSLRLHLEAGLS